MLNNQRTNVVESGRFWVKLEFAENSIGFMPAELIIYENDAINLICSRPKNRSFFKIFSSKPFAEGTLMNLAFQNANTFEPWSARLGSFVGFRDNSDEYELRALKLEMSSSERKMERLVLEVATKLKNTCGSKRLFCFYGCELSPKGLGLWFPNSQKDKIKINEIYSVSFEPKEVEPFSFSVQCIRPHCEDSFSRGFTAGFIFLDYREEGLASLRLSQILEARGKNKDLYMQTHNIKEHYLSNFWHGELLGTSTYAKS